MGCSNSKHSKSTRKISKLSKPSKPSKPIPLTPLPYPYLEPLPSRPFPHHPVASGPPPEQELASRYGRMLVENPIFANTQKPESVHRSQMETASAPQQSKRVKSVKPKAPSQFKPLNEIGRATDIRNGQAKSRPQPQSQSQSQRPRQTAAVVSKAPYQFKPLNEIGVPTLKKHGAKAGYGLYPSGQKGDFKDDAGEYSIQHRTNSTKHKE